jgi:hypothetical protein
VIAAVAEFAEPTESSFSFTRKSSFLSASYCSEKTHFTTHGTASKGHSNAVSMHLPARDLGKIDIALRTTALSLEVITSLFAQAHL